MNALPPVSIGDLLRYWRNTLADEDLMGLSATDSPVRTTTDAVRSGNLDEKSVKTLQRAWEDYRSRAARDQTAADLADSYEGAVPIVIFMKGFAPKHEHGKTIGNKVSGSVHYTLYVPATLSPSGFFSFTADSLPWIGREFMLPNEEADDRVPLVGEVEAFDKWLTRHPLGSSAWPDLMEWCDGLWTQVTGDRVPADFISLPDARIDVAKSVRYAGRNLCQLYDALLAEAKTPNLLNRLCRGSADHTIAGEGLRCRQLAAPRGTMSTAYGLANSQADAVAAFSGMTPGEILAVNGPPGTGKTTLLQSVIASEVVARAVVGRDPAVIVGTSTNNQAVVNINRSLNEILQENPAAALFPWARRWVPDAETYGLYLPAGEDKAKDAAKTGYAIAVKNGNEWTGFPEREKDAAYLTKARLDWLKLYGETYGLEPESVQAGLETLRTDLARITGEVQAVHGILDRFASIDHWWRATAGDVAPRSIIDQEEAGLTAAVEQATKACRDAEAAVEAARASRDAVAAKVDAVARAAEHAISQHQAHMHQLIGIKGKVLAALAPYGFLEALAEAIPFFRSLFVHKRIARLCALAAHAPLIGELFEREAWHNDPAAWAVRADQVIQEAAAEMARLRDMETEDARRRREDLARADDALRLAAQTRETAARKVEEAKASRQTRLDQLEAKINELYDRTSDLRQGYDALVVRAISDFQVKVPDERHSLKMPTIADFDWLLDVTWRHMAFQKAMRYWEGRWIIEAQGVQEDRVNVKGGRLGTEARFRRWCMLTPCLVVTLHSLPKHFRFTSRLGNDGAWVSNFMLDFVDLLIMDEAGQVGPHIGAAAFALASRAVVVGDIYQIEPVSRVSRGADYGNCARLGLGSMWYDGDPVSPHLVSEPSDGVSQGSVMRLAQSATCAVTPGTEKEPGILLTEHRRCRSEIVEYCNRLIYKGRLEPLSPPRPKEPPLPAMAWAHIRGSATKKGGSNINPLEAEALAGWIAENAEAWCGERYYGRPIEDVVAVVTPFRPQARMVKAALERAGKQFAKVTVGTVHSLQGAEKPIVVFSPTYSADTAKGLFFDRKPNMLNVAVSRAKDSFVVIGDMRLFRRSGRSPSSILGSVLFANDQSELPDVDGNYRFPRELLVQGERISTLDRHREVLRTALTEAGAGQLVVIASPWITMKAIEADGLPALISHAVQNRGAWVRIVVDRELSAQNPSHRAADAIAEMMRAGAIVSAVANMHNKTLITGPSEMVEGSFNWLSANRQRGDQFIRHETSWRVSGAPARTAVREAIEEFSNLGAEMGALVR